MAGQAAGNVRIAVKSRVFTAPIGSTAPVDVVSPWAAAWNDHGFTTQDGIMVNPKPANYDVKSGQTDTPVRTRIIERLTEIQVKLIQGGGLNSVLYNGGGTWAAIPTRTVNDGVLNGTTTLTSATAAFVAGDVGNAVIGTGIPAGTTIASRTNATTVIMSNAATITASGVGITVGGSGTFIYTPPTPGVDDNRMFGFEWVDGPIIKRAVYPLAIVINVSGYALKNTAELQYDVTFRCNGDSWFVLSNDPADNPAGLVA